MNNVNWHQAETWFKDEQCIIDKDWQQKLEESEDDLYEQKRENDFENEQEALD